MTTDTKSDRRAKAVADHYIEMQRKVISESPDQCKSLASVVDAIEACRHDGRPQFATLLMAVVFFDAHATGEEKIRLCGVLVSNKEVRTILSSFDAIASNVSSRN